jgi:hypothetical protein
MAGTRDQNTGKLAVDPNKNYIQTATYIKLNDGTGTPVVSGVEIADSGEQDIVIPAKALEMVIDATTDIMIEQDSGTTKTYAGMIIGCAGNEGGTIKFANDSGGALNLYFHFNMGR